MENLHLQGSEHFFNFATSIAYNSTNHKKGPSGEGLFFM